MSSHCLITGGCGFIGSHLCEAMLKAGSRVRVLDNLASGHLRNIDAFRGSVDVMIGDICDATAVGRAMDGVTHVFHEAALVSVFDSVQRPAANHEINLTGTLNVLMAAREHDVRRVVMASSAAVYGNNPENPKRESMTASPESPYAIGKLTGEYYMRLFHSLYGMETVSLRYFNVYGPRQDPSSVYSGVISRFMEVMRRGKSPTVFGDGMQSRDFVSVSDIVRANLLALFDPSVGRGEVFNVATGRTVTLLDLLGVMEEVLDFRVHPEFKPARAGDIRDSAASIDLIHQRLGFEPRVSLKDGLTALRDSLVDGNAIGIGEHA